MSSKPVSVKPSKVKQDNVAIFVRKAYQLFNDPKNSQCCGFDPKGEIIIIYDDTGFSNILRQYFKHGKLQKKLILILFIYYPCNREGEGRARILVLISICYHYDLNIEAISFIYLFI